MRFSQNVAFVLNLLDHFSQLDTSLLSSPRQTMEIVQKGNAKPLTEFSPTSKNLRFQLIKMANPKRVKRDLNLDHEPLTVPKKYTL